MSASLPVRIVGGGLAGLALGIALVRAGVPATIYEAGEYPRHRVCGEFLAGLDERALVRLGVDRAFAGAGLHDYVTWFLAERVIAEQPLPAPVRALSRFALDARLAETFVGGGGRLLTRARQALPRDDPGWVDAGGRIPAGSSRWLGLKLHVRDLASSPGLEVHLGDQAYVGVSRVEDGWTNVCGLFRRRAGLRVEREGALTTYLQASGLGKLAERVTGARPRPGSTCAVAGFGFARGATSVSGLHLGDAGGMIPPFTGNGMAIAFTGAALALDPLVDWSHGGCTWEAATGRIRETVRKTLTCRLRGAALLHPFLLRPPLQQVLGAVARTGLLPTELLYRLLH
jgi:flavin-dependent dehydrogenase